MTNVLFNHKQIAMCYNIATPQIWKDIFKVNSIDDIRSIIKNVSNKNIIKDGHGNTGWDIDQKELYEMVYNWNTKTNNLVCLDEKHTGFSRLDRITNFDINNLTIRKNIMKGKYTDYHCYRPMSKYAEINWEIYNLLSHTPINISNTSLSASTTIGT